MERLIRYGVRRFIGGPGRSWVVTSLAVLAFRFVRSTVGRREVVDVGGVARGQKIVIEHLAITHGEQLREEKQLKRAGKRTRKASRRAAKADKRAARAAS